MASEPIGTPGYIVFPKIASKLTLEAQSPTTTSRYHPHSRQQRFRQARRVEKRQELIEPLIGHDPKRIAWSSSLIANACRGVVAKYSASNIVIAHYRPFSKQFMYYDGLMNHRVGQMPKLWPKGSAANTCICVTATGNRGDFGVFISSLIPDLNFTGTSAACQCFPRYLYESADDSDKLDLGKKDGEIIDGYRRRDAITDAILKTFREAYGPKLTKEDIFYYVYGILHSPEYRTRFAADLKKMLPRIPLTGDAKDFTAFSRAGRKLAEWHLNYETIEPWPVVEVNQNVPRDGRDDYEYYRVAKMTFARPTPEQKLAGDKWNKTTINFNADITLTKIPLEAYEYVVNGKPAIEWIIERYQVTRDKDSGIVNDPNDWSREHTEPRYIVDLIKRLVRVSIETMKIVKGLPALNERK